MSEGSTSQALVDRILEGNAPLAVRAAAARGALPLPPAVLARLHLHLLKDPEEQIRQQAEGSLESLRQDELRQILSDPACAPAVLEHFAVRTLKEEGMAELLVFHPEVPDAALTTLAERGNAAVIDLVLTNQQRLLANPRLLDRLTSNPALRADQRGRILDLLSRFVKDGKPAGEADTEGAAAEEGSDQSLEETARLLDVDVGDLFASSEILDGQEFEQAEDPEIRSAYQKILTLNTAQKAMLAMRGGRDERLILVRDTNKVVALCVLRNPRLSEQEVEGMAKMRNVSDEVLRTIGTHREWVKTYTVVTSLVRNPRTPPGISTNFIPRLNNYDLKMLVRDKNVPEIIRRMAKRTYDTRMERKAPRFQKGRK